jgi:hypothetical protein
VRDCPSARRAIENAESDNHGDGDDFYGFVAAIKRRISFPLYHR